MVNEDREDDFGDAAPLEDDDNMVSAIVVPDSSNLGIKVEDFKKLLQETKEGSMLNTMLASDAATAQSKKIPQEMLFVSWSDDFEFTYKET